MQTRAVSCEESQLYNMLHILAQKGHRVALYKNIKGRKTGHYNVIHVQLLILFKTDV